MKGDIESHFVFNAGIERMKRQHKLRHLRTISIKCRSFLNEVEFLLKSFSMAKEISAIFKIWPQILELVE